MKLVWVTDPRSSFLKMGDVQQAATGAPPRRNVDAPEEGPEVGAPEEGSNVYPCLCSDDATREK
jgi:hypothetical protein